MRSHNRSFVALAFLVGAASVFANTLGASADAAGNTDVIALAPQVTGERANTRPRTPWRRGVAGRYIPRSGDRLGPVGSAPRVAWSPWRGVHRTLDLPLRAERASSPGIAGQDGGPSRFPWRPRYAATRRTPGE